MIGARSPLRPHGSYKALLSACGAVVLLAVLAEADENLRLTPNAPPIAVVFSTHTSASVSHMDPGIYSLAVSVSAGVPLDGQSPLSCLFDLVNHGPAGLLVAARSASGFVRVDGGSVGTETYATEIRVEAAPHTTYQFVFHQYASQFPCPQAELLAPQIALHWLHALPANPAVADAGTVGGEAGAERFFVVFAVVAVLGVCAAVAYVLYMFKSSPVADEVVREAQRSFVEVRRSFVGDEGGVAAALDSMDLSLYAELAPGPALEQKQPAAHHDGL